MDNWSPERRAATAAYNRGEFTLAEAASRASVSRAQMCRSARRTRKAPTLAEREQAAAAATGMAARRGETAQQARRAAQEPGPKGSPDTLPHPTPTA